MVKVMKVHKRGDMSNKCRDMKCRVIERVKRSSLRRIWYIERMPVIELLKRISMFWVDALYARGQPPVKVEDRVLDYVRERNVTRIGGCKERMLRCGHIG